MGNQSMKNDEHAYCGDESGFMAETNCSYDFCSRIRINYVDKKLQSWCNFNGFTINMSCNNTGKQVNWNNFGICNVTDFEVMLNDYANRCLTIWTDIDRFNGNNKQSVIKNITYDDNSNQYCIIFNDNIKNIDGNWHEKLYTAFVNYPLVSQCERIDISTNMHRPSRIEQQLTLMFNWLINTSYIDTNYSIFEETIEMKYKKHKRYLNLLRDENTLLANKIEQVMTTEKVTREEESNKTKPKETIQHTNTIQNKTERIDGMVDKSQQMTDQLQTQLNAIQKIKDENVLENDIWQRFEQECERIEAKIQLNCEQVQDTFNTIDLFVDRLIMEIEKLIECDWNDYNNSFKFYNTNVGFNCDRKYEHCGLYDGNSNDSNNVDGNSRDSNTRRIFSNFGQRVYKYNGRYYDINTCIKNLISDSFGNVEGVRHKMFMSHHQVQVGYRDICKDDIVTVVLLYVFDDGG